MLLGYRVQRKEMKINDSSQMKCHSTEKKYFTKRKLNIKQPPTGIYISVYFTNILQRDETSWRLCDVKGWVELEV